MQLQSRDLPNGRQMRRKRLFSRTIARLHRKFCSGLLPKLGTAVVCCLLLFFVVVSTSLYLYLRSQAVQEATERSEIILNQAESVGCYVRDVLRPKMYEILNKQDKELAFVVEAMSSTHVTHAVMDRFSREHPGYVFRRVSDRPLNRMNRADEFHRQLISFFEKNEDQSTWRGVQTILGKEMLVVARPVVSDISCLSCHGSKRSVPGIILARYGEHAYFDWPASGIVGVESVSIPLDVAFAEARRIAADSFFFGIVLVAILFLSLAASFHHILLKPLQSLTARFQNIAAGTEPLKSCPPDTRRDEVGTLMRSFNQLAAHLNEAQMKLKQQAEMERQFMQTQKLAAIGQLSAGVAHEINNPLGGIKACLDNISRFDMAPEDRAQHMALINKSVERIQSIVTQLLDYAKNRSLAIGPVVLSAVVDHVAEFLSYVLQKEGISLVKTNDADLPVILADSAKLEQVVLNLILNAIHAAGRHGWIYVETYRDMHGVCLSVSDNGPGIPPEIKDHIFDPFFTTKDVGQGSGLGLTVCKAIIDLHGGDISVSTSPKGTTFVITLPLCQNDTGEQGTP